MEAEGRRWKWMWRRTAVRAPPEGVEAVPYGHVHPGATGVEYGVLRVQH